MQYNMLSTTIVHTWQQGNKFTDPIKTITPVIMIKIRPTDFLSISYILPKCQLCFSI